VTPLVLAYGIVSAVLLLWLLAATGGGIGVALQRSESWWSIAAVLFLVGMTIFAIYLGNIRVYERSDRAALERGGLTPIVVDFVYKRRVAEVLLDFVLATVSYYAAYRLKFDFIEFAGNFTYFQRSLPVVVTVQLLAFFVFGVYRGVWRHFSSADAVTIVKGTIAGALASALILSYLFESGSRTVFVIYAVLVMLVIVGSRASFAVIAEALQRRRQGGERVVIYGAGDGGVVAVRELMNDPQHDVRIVGFVDDDARKRRTRVRGYPVLGAFDKLAHLVDEKAVDAIVLSIRSIDADRVQALRSICAQHGIPLWRLSVGLERLDQPGLPLALAPPAKRGAGTLH